MEQPAYCRATPLMDAQIPFHHAGLSISALTVCDRLGIRQMILGGDAL